MRLPDWAYAHMERVYLAQRRIRRQESRSRMEEWRSMVDHGMGRCDPQCPFTHEVTP